MRESAFGVGAIDVCMCKVPQGEHVHRMLHAETGKCLHHISRPRKLPAILASGENEGQLRTPLTAATAERPLPACSLEPCLSPDYKSCPPDPGRALYTVPDVWLAVESGPGAIKRLVCLVWCRSTGSFCCYFGRELFPNKWKSLD